ncbi:transcription factor CYCLOIDEA-like [Phalaenopsis equestris]|uniref:TCP transcription factor n=1 Tax=Phalaenopsis equestris TaxID=78828 RepID=A0A1D6ZNI5_PHAEQ|nr:transcription factor CYCLOIDEA-like [Phalaenopsis equestris]ANU06236.1 TCP transcription factor [Phalaenopsis equestris]
MFSQPYYTSSSFFPFSPPAFHQYSLHDIFIPAASGAEAGAPVSAQPIAGWKRKMRKDMHSKIYTAKGPRDRRMRFSLDVARKLFDLQDLLGFDKASKTVQWILTMSKAAIKELVGAASICMVVSSSEGEDISTVSDNKDISTSAIFASEFEKNAKPKSRILRSRPISQPKLVAKELREKARARARARERTLEKKMMRCCRPEDGSKSNQQANILKSIPLGSFLQEEYSSSHDLKSSLDFVAEMEEHCSTSPIMYAKEHDHNGSSSAVVFDCNQQTAVSLFQEQWDHRSAFPNNYMDEKVLFGEVSLQTSYGRGISMPSMFDHVTRV